MFFINFSLFLIIFGFCPFTPIYKKYILRKFGKSNFSKKKKNQISILPCFL